jgi:ABC-type antimicrobial peptide transport system permease subunit
MRRAVHTTDPELPLFGSATMDEVRTEQLRIERLSSGGLTLFGIAALFFAAVGTYGILAVAVARRRREIAVRLALGAPRGLLLRRLIGRGMALALAGLALGLLAGLAVSHALAGQLYGVTPTDPVSFAGVSILLLDVAFIACWLPARRILDVDPAEALREE